MMMLRSSVWRRCTLLLALTAAVAAVSSSLPSVIAAAGGGTLRSDLNTNHTPARAVSTLQSQSETLELYTLKAFAVSITSAAIQNADADSLPLETMEYTLTRVTEKYLKEFFDAQVMHEASPLEAVRAVDLEVSMRRASQRQRQRQRQRRYLQGGGGLWAEVHGTAVFRNNTEKQAPTRDEAEAFLATLMEQAFVGNYLEIYKERLEASGEIHFQNLIDFQVTTNVPTLVQQTGGGDEGGGWSALEYSLLAVMFILLFSCMFCIVLYVRTDRDRTDKTVYSQEESHDFYGSHNNLACMAERRGLHATTSSSSSPRSYTNGTSPLGAAAWASRTTTNTSTQSSSQQERIHQVEDAVDHHIHRAGPYTQQEGGSLASWVKSLSTSFMTSKEEEEVQFMTGENGKSFIYKDFPRHDGTPCLIYNESPPNHTNNKPRSRANSRTMWASSVSPKSNKSLEHETQVEQGEGEEAIDSFVDRLEQLMVVRHEQYQERCNMEWERDSTMRKQRTYSRDGPVITVQEAEAALEDFLNVDAAAAAVVTPPNSPPHNQVIYQEQVLTDEKKIDQAMRAQQEGCWGEDDDPTISGIMT
jgi:hypothetical protein